MIPRYIRQSNIRAGVLHNHGLHSFCCAERYQAPYSLAQQCEISPSAEERYSRGQNAGLRHRANNPARVPAPKQGVPPLLLCVFCSDEMACTVQLFDFFRGRLLACCFAPRCLASALFVRTVLSASFSSASSLEPDSFISTMATTSASNSPEGGKGECQKRSTLLAVTCTQADGAHELNTVH